MSAIRMPPNNGRAPYAGFTLVEMVVAVALVGLIAVALVESLRFGQRAYAAVVGNGGDAWDVFAGQRLVRNLVESAYPQETSLGSSSARVAFEGTREAVGFLASAPLASGGSGLYRYEIRLREKNGARDLVAQWRAELASASGANARNELDQEVLVPDVAAVEWAFMAAAAVDRADDLQPAWESTWQGRQDQPVSVRLRVAFRPQDARQWPDLIMSPRITDDANCAFDIVAQRCRSTP